MVPCEQHRPVCFDCIIEEKFINVHSVNIVGDKGWRALAWAGESAPAPMKRKGRALLLEEGTALLLLK